MGCLSIVIWCNVGHYFTTCMLQWWTIQNGDSWSQPCMRNCLVNQIVATFGVWSSWTYIIISSIRYERTIPVSRIEFTLKSSVYWPIIGLGMRTWSVAMRCRDPAGQSEFFVRVLHLKTFNWMYCYREFIVGIVVSAIAVFRLVDNIFSSSLHC